MSFVICLPYTAGTVTMCVVAISSVAFTIVLTSYSSFKMFYDKTLSIQFKSFYYLSNISWIVAASGHAMNACFPLLLTNCWDAIGPLAFIGFWGYAIAFTLLYLLSLLICYGDVLLFGVSIATKRTPCTSHPCRNLTTHHDHHMAHGSHHHWNATNSTSQPCNATGEIKKHHRSA
eukprot:937175_1